MNKLTPVILLVPPLIVALSQCSDTASDSTSGDAADPAATAGSTQTGTTSQTSSTGKLSISDNSLAASYPEGLAVTAFPKTVDATPGQAAAGTLQIETSPSLSMLAGGQEFDPFKAHPKERLKETKARLDGTATSCFSDEIAAALGPAPNLKEICYGFDYGMVAGTTRGLVDGGRINPALSNQSSQSTSSLLAALEGISGLSPDTSQEVCMVGTGRILIKAAVARVDSALQLFQGMLCQAKKDGTAATLPDVGATLDLSSAFSNFSGSNPNPMTFSDVSIERLDDVEGRQVYKSALTYTVKPQNSDAVSTTVTIVHSPGAESNTTYNGVMYIKGDVKDHQTNENFSAVTSVLYAKSGTTVANQKITFEVRNARLNTTRLSADPLTSEGLVNYNAGAGSDGSFGSGQANEYISGIEYFAFEVNPSTYAGKISFWVNPGGNFQEAARGFIFDTTQASDGTLGGCAFSGAVREGSIRRAVKRGEILQPSGCYTPQHSNGVCGNANDNIGSQIWKQCFKQNSQGVYVIDATKVTDTTNGFDVLPTAPPDMPKVDLTGMKTLGTVR